MKKYIRLQLYKHALTETPTPVNGSQRISINELKDCSLAEKDEQAGVNLIFSILRNAHGRDLLPLMLYTALAFAGLYFLRKNKQELVLLQPRRGSPQLIPLYLQFRHLRV